MNYEDKLARYDKIVALCPRFERKGKTMPYTSTNGHMFSILNKEGDLGFRFAKDAQEKYFQEFNSEHLISHGAKLKGYVKITEPMFNNLQKLADLLNKSYDYAMSLDPK